MSRIKSDALHHPVWVMGSDDDQPVIEEIYVGFDARDNLIITIDHTDYDDHRYDCSTWIIVDVDEANILAHRLKVEYRHLPALIRECMADWRTIVNATLSNVQGCFKEIAERLLDEGSRFRIERTHGPREWSCC